MKTDAIGKAEAKKRVSVVQRLLENARIIRQTCSSVEAEEASGLEKYLEQRRDSLQLSLKPKARKATLAKAS